VALITVIGLLLRLPSLGNALFGDEVGSYYIVTGHSVGQILHQLDGHSFDLNPPLYYLASWAVERFGSSPELLRLVSLLAGTVAIPLTFVLGLRTVGRRAAIAAAILVALSPFLIFYSTEARAYALVMALVLGSTLALLRGLETSRPSSWAVYAVLSCAAIYTHYSAVFVLGAQLLWAFIGYPDARRALIAANAAAAIGFAAWVPALIKNTHSFGTKVFGVLEPFGLRAVSGDLAHAAVGHPYIALAEVPGTVAVVLILTGTVVAVVATGPAVRQRLKSSRAWLPIVLAVATPVGLVLYSALRESVWDMRNLISSWPGFAVALGTVLTGVRGRFTLVPLALVAGGFAVGATSLLSAGYQRPDYTAAVRFVLHDGRTQDPVAIVQAPTNAPLAAVDAALAYAGQRRRTVLRIGSPPLQAVLRAPPYALLPPTPGAVLASQAGHLAGASRLFVIAPGTAGLAALLHSGRVDARAVLGPLFGSGTTGALLATTYEPLSSFMRAAGRWFRPVESRTFPGFLKLSVYVFERR
jgi:4-amino-4-deoxy-L-arabinose transferase-like glycosyltransferase